ncbi:alpha-amylase family glycosyl hydrolase [Mastigocoleus sp. MO_188.B34]|uniref:alpha-amylase family glycosyl hydrolase n=1 Tax=Mastigocoleus sp. MO_188.B34 TaxID=3036635 RepID=UPI002613CECD|nr:alpha-amylase family glycosyl hydrolase [Mastigocoleus sp. MO_188.B34]MDJ0693233.1 alpha-amylase family glycosyl hydrolase [Mastigocoleus sp. MO_188.B34]
MNTATIPISTSVRTGMGAIPFDGGTTFRVWAPFASSVSVTATFNGWSDTANPLASENNGYWSADITGAKIGEQYKYVIVNRDTGNIYKKNDPYAREVTNSAGNSVICALEFDWSNDNYRTPNWNEMVIYEMHVGTFNDLPGGAPGNFNGVIQRLDYLRDLGINVIKLMPPTEFAADFSWGYNPANIFAIESVYGGPEGFKKFVKACHQRGISIVFDVVYNHLGPSDLDLWQFDGWNENDKGGIYFYNDWRSKTPWGDTRPDYGRPEVRQYIRDNALMWLSECHVDGLRWDSTVNIRTQNNGGGGEIPSGWSLMQWINNEINTSSPWKISIAEDLQNNEWITKDTGAGGAGFDAQWDPSFVHPIRDTIIPPNDNGRNMYAVRDAIYHRYNGDAFERVIYSESHDEVANGRSRVPEEIWPGNAGSWFARKRSTMAATLVFTSPGIPMIFQGQEILEDQWFHDQDPIDWSKLDTYRGIHDMYRDLIRLRRNWYNNTRGLRGQYVNVHHVNNKDKVIAFHRWENGGPGDDVIVVVNMADRSYDSYNIGFPKEGYWQIRFNSDWNGYSPDFGNHLGYDTTVTWGEADGMPCNGNIGIAPYSAIILSQ